MTVQQRCRGDECTYTVSQYYQLVVTSTLCSEALSECRRNPNATFHHPISASWPGSGLCNTLTHVIHIIRYPQHNDSGCWIFLTGFFISRFYANCYHLLIGWIENGGAAKGFAKA